MAFRSVSQQEFHAYGPSHGGTTARLTDEHESFTDDAGGVIGVMAKAPHLDRHRLCAERRRDVSRR
jgi:hypothetical protein